MLHKTHPILFPTEDAARTTIRKVIGKEKGSKVIRVSKPDYQGEPPPLPASKSKDWAPVELSAKNALILSDIHLPYHDTEALECALKYGDKIKPDLIFLNGDVVDFYSISRYETDPEERDLKGEIESTRQFFNHIRARFKKARIVFKLGNHDERWWPFIWRRCPEILGIDALSLPSLLHADKHGIEVISDQRIIMLGKLPVLHGHELPKGLTNPVNPARGVFMRALDRALIGHHHRTSEHTETTMLDRTITCWSTGCLCELHPAYARINRWNHGFASVTIQSGGDFSVENHRIKGGRIL
jgi:predicted phosphodiesterase